MCVQAHQSPSPNLSKPILILNGDQGLQKVEIFLWRGGEDQAHRPFPISFQFVEKYGECRRKAAEKKQRHWQVKWFLMWFLIFLLKFLFVLSFRVIVTMKLFLLLKKSKRSSPGVSPSLHSQSLKSSDQNHINDSFDPLNTITKVLTLLTFFWSPPKCSPATACVHARAANDSTFSLFLSMTLKLVGWILEAANDN